VKFLFPGSVKHLPNHEQIALLSNLTMNAEFPGFLHTETLALTKRSNKIWLTHDRKIKYDYVPMTHKDLALTLENSRNYIAFGQIRTYVLDAPHSAIGLITDTFDTILFETPVSTGEIFTAQQFKGPIVVKFINIGRSTPCDMCIGQGAIDWVAYMTNPEKDKKLTVPKNRYILANYMDMYFLIDNQPIQLYEGDNILHVCPLCLGSGLGGVVIRADEEIKLLAFDNEMYDQDRLYYVRSGPDVVELPHGYHINLDSYV